MGDVIDFTPRSHSMDPNRATRKALAHEAVREAELGFTDEELADLREALNQTDRKAMIEKCKEQCVKLRTLLNVLLDTYKNA